LGSRFPGKEKQGNSEYTIEIIILLRIGTYDEKGHLGTFITFSDENPCNRRYNKKCLKFSNAQTAVKL
jgi:hypothetical protein